MAFLFFSSSCALRQLKYFLAIADCGSFSAAAERVFVAQSALSHQMAQLEDELGVALFLRTRRGVALTDAGQRFYPHAVSILRQTDEAAQAARSGSGEPSGKVVFGIPHSVSQALALPLLRAVRRALPQVQLELTEELTGNLTPQLRAGQIQLAVLFDEVTAALDPETVQEVLVTIRELIEEGMTCLLVTHEMGFAREVAGHVYFTDRGVIVEHGPPAEIFSAPRDPRTQEFLGRLLHH